MSNRQGAADINRRALLALGAAAALGGCGGGNWSEVVIPMPAVLRQGIQFGYYLSLPGQMAATADHTSVFWHAQFYPLDVLQVELAGGSQDVVLDCAAQLFPNLGEDKRFLAADGEVKLRGLFADMRTRGILGRVKYLTPMDEPNLFCASEAELRRGIAVLKRVAAEFEELRGVRYVCIYGVDTRDLWALEEFDIVGVDNYKQWSETLTRGSHAALMERLLPGQQAMVIPGAAFGQDPASFVAYAHGEPRVWGVIAFIWAHVPESADKEGWVGLSLQSAEARQRYRDAALLTLNRG